MPVVRLLRQQTIGETRWVAVDAAGRAAALYLERASDTARADIGRRIAARVRKIEPAAGGAFVDLGARGEGFLRTKAGDKLTEGAGVAVEVVAEARGGKLARVRLAVDAADEVAGVAAWHASLAGGETAAVEDRAAGDAEIGAAFGDALEAKVTLPGGGRLQVERTEALVAADIDSAGRPGKLARSLNPEAASELARQMLLRGWGGLAVLDCVGTLDKAAGAAVRQAFLSAFRDLSARSVKALPPSAFGLMEISADWQLTPLAERLTGKAAAETLALEGLRRLEAAARENRMARLTLHLPPAAFAWLGASGLGAEAALAQVYGARLTLAAGTSDSLQVRATE